MFVTNYFGLLTFGLVFNHVKATVITRSSEDENSEFCTFKRNYTFFYPYITVHGNI